MMFSLLTMMLAMFASMAAAQPIRTCSDQKDCIQFTAHKIDDDSVCDCDCYYNICMTISYAGACSKTGTISHTCEKDSDLCANYDGFGNADEVGGIGDGYTSCQKVPAGGQAEFLLKDGNAANGCGEDSIAFQSDYEASCETFFGNSCTGAGNVGKECVWTIPAPNSCNKVGGCFGDPHIKRWDSKRFDFHGECDLVLLHSDHVNGGVPLDLHIRTTIQGYFSYIESAALKVGESVLQLDTDKFFVNGEINSETDLPLSLEEFTIETVKQDGIAKIYTIVLSDSSVIKFKVIKNFLSVSVSGHEDDFGESVGLLGNYYTGEALGRDGNLIEDFEQYGMEWQVTESEMMLFQDARAPQLPEAKCNMPTETAMSRRRLRNNNDHELVTLAERVCSTKEDFESCMEDVLATGDIDLAGAW